LQIKGKKNWYSYAEKKMVLQFLPSNFIFNQLPYFNAFSLWSLGPKKGFKLAWNWPSNFKHLAIVSLQTRAKILFAIGILAFTVDIQTKIS